MVTESNQEYSLESLMKKEFNVSSFNLKELCE